MHEVPELDCDVERRQSVRHERADDIDGRFTRGGKEDGLVLGGPLPAEFLCVPGLVEEPDALGFARSLRAAL
jgi:hypothetical protein